jgi:predicted PurR-regulated permease PerM
MGSIISVSIAAVVLAALAYVVIRRPFLAAFIAAALVAAALQVYVRLELGYMDKFWPIAAVISFANAFIVGLVVTFSWRFLVDRSRRKA